MTDAVIGTGPERSRVPQSFAIESKRDRFLRVAEPRVRRALKAIEIIGLIGGSNKYNYDFGSTDVEEIAAALRDAVDVMEMRLGRKPRQLKLFELQRGNGGV